MANFLILTYGDGHGIEATSHCNYVFDETCMHIFRARGACFATVTLLLLIHTYNCKNLAVSLFEMPLLDNKVLLAAFFFGFSRCGLIQF